MRKGQNTVFGVTIGTGIGGGLIVQGEIFRGAGSAGEVGHMTVEPNGRTCDCGRSGCLERYVAAPAIQESYRRHSGALAEPGEIIRRWERHEKAARIVMREITLHLAVCLASAVTLFDPSCLVLGGGLMDVSRTWSVEVSNEIRLRLLPMARKSITIVRAQLGNRAGVVGASLAALKEALGSSWEAVPLTVVENPLRKADLF